MVYRYYFWILDVGDFLLGMGNRICLFMVNFRYVEEIWDLYVKILVCIDVFII